MGTEYGDTIKSVTRNKFFMKKLIFSVLFFFALVPIGAHALTQNEVDVICALIGCDSAQKIALNALVSEGPKDDGGSCFTFTRDLSLGATGTDVLELQKFLNNKGFTIVTSGFGSPGNETSYFGPLTGRALTEYQTARGISPLTWYFGGETRSSVNEENCGDNNNSEATLSIVLDGDDTDINSPRNIVVDEFDDTDDVELLSFNLHAKAGGTDLEIDSVPIALDIVGTDRLSHVLSGVSLYADGKLIDSESIPSYATSTIVFDSLDLEITKGDEVDILITADFNDMGTGRFDFGDKISAKISDAEYSLFRVEDAEGESLRTYQISGAVMSGPHTFVDNGGGTATSTDFRVLTPNGGEEWLMQSTPNVITWTPDPHSGEVIAYLEKKDSLGRFITVGRIIPIRKGSIVWDGEVGQFGSYPQQGEYYVKLVNTETGQTDRSDRSFDLINPVTEYEIHYTGPAHNSTYENGDQVKIEWDADVSDVLLDIKLLNKNHGFEQYIARGVLPYAPTASVRVPNNYIWTIPNDFVLPGTTAAYVLSLECIDQATGEVVCSDIGDVINVKGANLLDAIDVNFVLPISTVSYEAGVHTIPITIESTDKDITVSYYAYIAGETDNPIATIVENKGFTGGFSGKTGITRDWTRWKLPSYLSTDTYQIGVNYCKDEACSWAYSDKFLIEGAGQVQGVSASADDSVSQEVYDMIRIILDSRLDE